MLKYFILKMISNYPFTYDKLWDIIQLDPINQKIIQPINYIFLETFKRMIGSEYLERMNANRAL